MSAEHEAVRDLIAAVALDAATPEEVSRVERHAAGCVVCGDELDSLRRTAGMIALSVPQLEPPPGLRGRVMGEVAADRRATAKAAPAGRPRRAGLFSWPALSGALAAIAIGLLAWNISLQSGADPAGTRVLPIEASVGRGGEVSLVSRESRVVALVRLEGLPEPKVGEGWELWRIPADGAPVSAGFLERQPDGSYTGTVDVPAGKITLGVTPESLENRTAPSVAPIAAVALPS